MSGNETGVIAGLTVPAHVRPHVVDRTSGFLSHDSHEGRAAIPVTAHPAFRRVNERRRNARQHAIFLEGKARPIGRERAARAARLAQRGLLYILKR